MSQFLVIPLSICIILITLHKHKQIYSRQRVLYHNGWTNPVSPDVTFQGAIVIMRCVLIKAYPLEYSLPGDSVSSCSAGNVWEQRCFFDLFYPVKENTQLSKNVLDR